MSLFQIASLRQINQHSDHPQLHFIVAQHLFKYKRQADVYKLFTCFPDKPMNGLQPSRLPLIIKRNPNQKRVDHMIALQIKNIRDFMNSLLLQDTFDWFLVSEASITTFTTFSISGDLRREFLDQDQLEQDEYKNRSQVTWKEIRSFCLSVIKGKRTPLSFKFVFQLPADQVGALLDRFDLPFQPEDVYGLFFNCQYQNETLTLTTGSSLRIFTLDRSLDQAWDRMLTGFLENLKLIES